MLTPTDCLIYKVQIQSVLIPPWYKHKFFMSIHSFLMANLGLSLDSTVVFQLEEWEIEFKISSARVNAPN